MNFVTPSIGAWRTHYPLGRRQGPKIDSSGELPNGSVFQDVAGLKTVLAKRQDQFARVLTEKLLAYSCGRRIEPLDRPQVDRILSAVKKDGDGLRTLVEQVVLSEVFRSK